MHLRTSLPGGSHRGWCDQHSRPSYSNRCFWKSMRVKLNPSISFWKLGVLLFSTMIAGCGESSQSDTDSSIAEGSKYLFIGHAYNRAAMDNTIDPRLTKIDFNQYDGIWWGGDVTVSPNLKSSQLTYLAEVARMDDPNTLWAYGNHEYNPQAADLAAEKLGKARFTFWQKDKLGVFVFNSAFARADCENKNDQLNAFREVVANSTELSQFVFLSHHVIWSDIVPDAEVREVANSIRPGQLLGCSFETTFEDVIQPRLHNMVEQGIQVVCLAGDAGIRTKKNAAWKDEMGVEYVLCGIGDSKEHPSASSFESDELITISSSQSGISWELNSLDSLIASH